MADNDRRTTIDGDQITDHSIKPRELDTVNEIKDPQRWQLLMWDKVSQKMKWFYIFGNRILK